ncbi:MAG TPA: fasciclin domain-containing protein [Panacibacter sp.]|nr:fasciclin domain-containing protein [Panacibacter sp.]
MQKTSVVKSLLASLLLTSLITAGCNKDDDPTPAPISKNIAEIVSGDTTFSFLLAAAVKAGLDGALAGTSPLTVFAPTNNAFRALGYTTAASVSAEDAATLSSILLYHILDGTVKASSVPAGPNASVTTKGGLVVYATNNSGGVYINGIKVTTADITASNGVIHVIGSVLIPPSGNIVETAIATPDFSYLVAAVLKASTGTTNVAAALSGAGPLTVFAPTNQAFVNAGFTTIDDINNADPDVLAGILTYHVIAARVFSSDLTNGLQPATLNGETVTINLGTGATVTGVGNTTASKIKATNIVATNGVIHVIDQVLLP